MNERQYQRGRNHSSVLPRCSFCFGGIYNLATINHLTNPAAVIDSNLRLGNGIMRALRHNLISWRNNGNDGSNRQQLVCRLGNIWHIALQRSAKGRKASANDADDQPAAFVMAKVRKSPPYTDQQATLIIRRREEACFHRAHFVCVASHMIHAPHIAVTGQLCLNIRYENIRYHPRQREYAKLD